MKNQKSILSPQERRQRNREEMRHAILEAARQVMREEGVAALNLQEVRVGSGYAHPLSTSTFQGKWLSMMRSSAWVFVFMRNA